MLNHIILVGRLVRDPELKKFESGSKLSKITLAVPRSYKNVTGEYGTDFIECTLWKGIAENTTQYCKKGDILAVKGRIESKMYELNNEKKYTTEIIAEKVTFLSSKPKEEKE